MLAWFVLNRWKNKQSLDVPTYGIFFALTSGIIIYRPDTNATDYGFSKPPHIELSPCCDLPGYMPMVLAFFTEHMGLQIIPLNLVLLVVVSFLVGLNFALASAIFIHRNLNSNSSWNSIYHDKKNQKSTEWKLCGRN
ncbi:MAG: hypothetical protein AUI61_00405 [Thaumarchaeota archaeon 13_1_40CM_2_39_13_2]|nr:MAG: hypothetical protein AUI61_00405 [Thaumarchaeota archaeon 13_1_40CM_2_39_13_2]OLE40058.1 MAG: hypothetical protein AUG16_05835 [Thaumarchaeota archaeon 13_1_20CM_2_39_20]